MLKGKQTLRANSRYNSNFMKRSQFTPTIRSNPAEAFNSRRHLITEGVRLNKYKEAYDDVHGTFPNMLYVLKSEDSDMCVSMDNAGANIIVAPMDITNPKQWVMVNYDAGTITFFHDLLNHLSLEGTANTSYTLKRSDILKNALLKFNTDKTISLCSSYSNYYLAFSAPAKTTTISYTGQAYPTDIIAPLLLVDKSKLANYKHKWTFVKVRDLRTQIDNDQTILALNQQIEINNTQIGNLNSQIVNLQEQAKKTEEMNKIVNADKDTLITRYEDTIQAYESEIRGHEETIKGQQDKMKIYENTLLNYEDKIKTYENALVGYEKKLQGYEGNLTQYEGQLGKYKGTVSDYEGRINDYAETVDDYENKLGIYEGIINNYETLLNKYESNWFVKWFLIDREEEKEEKKEEKFTHEYNMYNRSNRLRRWN